MNKKLNKSMKNEWGRIDWLSKPLVELHGRLIISQRFRLAGVEIREEMRDFPLFLTKAWPMDSLTDQQMDGRTDGQTLL